jgi:hypothetical protein
LVDGDEKINDIKILLDKFELLFEVFPRIAHLRGAWARELACLKSAPAL